MEQLCLRSPSTVGAVPALVFLKKENRGRDGFFMCGLSRRGSDTWRPTAGNLFSRSQSCRSSAAGSAFCICRTRKLSVALRRSVAGP